jgi:chromosome partitioning protein
VRTISILSQKGGAGKTTIAIHLAAMATAAGYVSLIVDTDPQATAKAWSDWRAADEPEVITAPHSRLAQTLADAEKLGAEIVLIDTPPHADATAVQAAKVSDLALIPCRPQAFDLHAMSATADLIAMTKKPASSFSTAFGLRLRRSLPARRLSSLNWASVAPPNT